MRATHKLLPLWNFLKHSVAFKETKTKTKKTTTKEKSALVKPAFEEESLEDYEFIIALSKETNRNVAHRLAKEKNIILPSQNKK